MSGSATVAAVHGWCHRPTPGSNRTAQHGSAFTTTNSVLTEEGQHVGVGHRGSCAWMVPPPHPWQQQNSSTRQRIHNNEQCAH